MILTRISDYLKKHRRASLVDMAYSLDASPDALRNMLAILERKGRVQRLLSSSESACGGCTKCQPTQREWYEWSNPSSIPVSNTGTCNSAQR